VILFLKELGRYVIVHRAISVLILYFSVKPVWMSVDLAASNLAVILVQILLFLGMVILADVRLKAILISVLLNVKNVLLSAISAVEIINVNPV
jgi:hypothetical protein